MTVKIRMWTKEGYQRDVLVFDDKQVRSTCTGVEDTTRGFKIDPTAYPEAVYFTVVIDWSK